ncbi:hypothetical protein [Streptomyces sp. NPDC047718]|uniref:hypothetical protein n=1 Tax=Streptomyces sp. NPDC047718 TaxID=3155479 RepID=UPI0033CB42AD
MESVRPLQPLLFLDVDGPLIPFGATPRELPHGYPLYGPADDGNPLLARLVRAHGRRLRRARRLAARASPARPGPHALSARMR